MSHRLIVTPRAEADIEAAAIWYENESAQVAQKFLDAVDATLELIERDPYQYQTLRRNVRGANIKRFPYGLMYLVAAREVTIIACFHGRQNPRRWQDRLR